MINSGGFRLRAPYYDAFIGFIKLALDVTR